MKTSIGILAYNEDTCISDTIRSLLTQSVFQRPISSWEIEIVVVPNGCTDTTASAAREALTELTGSIPTSYLRWQICEVSQASKPNAWNRFVHEFADPVADYLILMDADIQFLEIHTLNSLIQALESDPKAQVSVDTLVKDIALKPSKSLMERLSLSVSKLSGASSVWISGQLYCGRGALFRQIWMPAGIEVEDGFLWKMVVTNGLTTPEIPNRVVRAAPAAHMFEAYTNIKLLLRHERWLIAANTINSLIFADLSSICNFGQDAGSLIRLRNEEDPFWVDRLIQANAAQKGWWIIPRELFLRRFQSLRRMSLPKTLLLLPVSVLAFAVDLLVCIQVNADLHRRSQSDRAR